jgi:SIR2-like domain
MSEISRDIDEGRYAAAITTIASELLREDNEGQCLIFIGAGASVSPGQPSLPSGATLSAELAAKCTLEWHDYIPLSTIAFHYEYYYNRDQLNSFLRERLTNRNIQPSPTISTLAKIIRLLETSKNSTVFVVTTNYDQHFERAYQLEAGHSPEVIIYNGGVDANDDRAVLYSYMGQPITCRWLPKRSTYLYKIHGCISQPGGRNLVITEEDYVNFLSNALHYDERKRLLNYATSRFAEGPILFVGYSLSDWNFRVVFKATAERNHRDCYAVQYIKESKGPRRSAWNAAVDFWGEKRVRIINEDGARFMQDLLEAVTHECQRLGRAAAPVTGA